MVVVTKTRNRRVASLAIVTKEKDKVFVVRDRLPIRRTRNLVSLRRDTGAYTTTTQPP